MKKIILESSLLPDMPKLESPFVRNMINREYIVSSKITSWYEWVFEDNDVIAMEKLNGTNISIEIKDKKPVRIQNRLNKVAFWDKSKAHIIEWIYESFYKWYLDLSDWVYFWELRWPKLQWNPYDLDKHIWIPFFTYAKQSLAYKSWWKYETSFNSISNWFKGDDIFSLYYRKIHKWTKKKPEGIVFYSPSKNKLAKLRLDMFDWYKWRRHRI